MLQMTTNNFFNVNYYYYLLSLKFSEDVIENSRLCFGEI